MKRNIKLAQLTMFKNVHTRFAYVSSEICLTLLSLEHTLVCVFIFYFIFYAHVKSKALNNVAYYT